MDPAIERVQNDGRSASHFHRLGQIAESIQEAAHRDLGRYTAALRASHPVGDCGDHVGARLGQLRTENDAGEVLIVFARTGLGGEPHTHLQAGKARRHCRNLQR